MNTNSERIKKGMWWDRAWSLVEGCAPVSEGCANCWSASQTHIRSNQKNEKIKARYDGLTENGQWTGRIRLMWSDLKKPLHVKKPTVWAIWNDLFHPDVPYRFVDEAMAIIADTPHHTYVLLTKRPARMARYFNDQERYSARKVADIKDSQFGKFDCDMLFPLPNLVLGVTAENQRLADDRIPDLLQTPAAARVVSVEPMLGPVDINNWLWADIPGKPRFSQINWVICGGESGPGARPMHPAWAKSLRDQCLVGVPFFFKQWGEWAYRPFSVNPKVKCRICRCGIVEPTDYTESTLPKDYFLLFGAEYVVKRVGKKKAGRLLTTGEWNELPKI